ncbi:response regulator transcription factor [Leifsonia sp. 2TAF2]|uniref:helix-turn-helix transcriptional regulator n=1 Tax=Leifsonia sp. 2TAF2 TaxID=3233009 RepID=UPI003F9A4FEA
MERANDTTSRTSGWSQLNEALRSSTTAQAAEVAREHWFDLLAWPVHGADPVGRHPDSAADEPVLAALFALMALDDRSGGWSAFRRWKAAIPALDDPAEMLPTIDRAIILATKAELHRREGRPEWAATAARAGIAELDALPVVGADHADTVSGLYARFGASLLDTSPLDGAATGEALDTFVKGLESARDQALSSASANLAMLASVHARQGDTRRARNILAAAADTAPIRPDDAAMFRTAEAILAVDRLDAPTATGLLARVAPATGRAGHWMPYVLATAMAELLNGYPGRALAFLDQSVREGGPEGRTEAGRGALAPARAVLQLSLGHPDAASAVLRREPVGDVGRRIGTARVELVLGRHGAALQQLRPLSAMTMSIRESAEASALEVAALLRFSTEKRAAPVLDHLGALLSNSRELLLPLALLPPQDLTKVARALGSLGFQEIASAPGLRSVLPDAGPGVFLTRRETAVLTALLVHSSHTAIASQLSVSVNTVKSQLRSVYRKLDVSTRDQAIAVALERHLLVEKE